MATTDHLHIQIRDRVAALLSGATDAGTRVYKGRVWPTRGADLPALMIGVAGSAEAVLAPMESDGTGKSYRRQVSIVVEARANATTGEGAENAIWALIRDVEEALEADPFLSALAWSCDLTRIATDLDGDHDRPVAAGQMIYTVTAQTAATDPTTNLP